MAMADQSKHSPEKFSSSMAHMGTLEEVVEHRDDRISVVDETVTLAGTFESKAVKPRAYQLEMLEESLKGNIIVAV